MDAKLVPIFVLLLFLIVKPLLAYHSHINNNCSYSFEEVFCECDKHREMFKCFNIESSEDIIIAMSHLMNVTNRYYWNQLEVNCIEPFDRSPKNFHINSEIFLQGPKFRHVIFNGDCSKPNHYDNLVSVDRDVEKLVIRGNTLRFATTCSVFQVKLERLYTLHIVDSVLAGNMISGTFSTRCLGQYGQRNEALPLMQLRITASNITLIETGAFQNFADLEVIDLSHNQLSHLSRQTFASHLYKLRDLDLRGNRLTELTDEFFTGLPQLRQVNLVGNLLTTLPAIPLNGLPQVVLLDGNPWDCRCKMDWMVKEKNDGKRFYDEPSCASPDNVKDFGLMDGLQFVYETFC